MRSLRDKANVALGFAALQNDTRRGRAPHARARAPDRPARQQGAARLRLGRGRAEGAAARAGALDRTRRARRRATPAVLEARIAVPYAYAELGAYGAGARALQRRDRRLRAREPAASTSRSPPSAPASCSTACSSATPAKRWAGSGTSASCREMPHASHLTQVLARPRVPGSLQELPRPAVPVAATCRTGKTSSACSATCSTTAARPTPSGCRRCAPRPAAVDLAALRQAPRRRRRRGRRAPSASRTPPPSPTSSDRELLDLLARRAGRHQVAGRRCRRRAHAPARAAGRRRADLAAGAGVPGARCGTRRRTLQIIDAELAAGARARRGAGAGAARRAGAQRGVRRAHRRAGAAHQGADPARGRAHAATSSRQCRSWPWPSSPRQKDRLVAYSQQARFAVAQMYDRATLRHPGRTDDAAK